MATLRDPLSRRARRSDDPAFTGDLLQRITAFADSIAVSDRQRAMLRLAMTELPERNKRALEGYGFSISGTLPAAVYEAVAGGRQVPAGLPAACTLTNLALDILDDLADGDWPEHWGDHSPAEMELTGTLILSVLVPEAQARTTSEPHVLACLEQVHRQSLLRMADGQALDLAAPGADAWDIATARAVLVSRGPDQVCAYAAMAATLAGGGDATIDALARYAHHLTSALTLMGDRHELLQSTGKDLRQGKRTLPLVAHVNSLNPQARSVFLKRLQRARTSQRERTALNRDLAASAAVAAASAYVSLDLACARAALGKAGITKAGRCRLLGFIDKLQTLC